MSDLLTRLFNDSWLIMIVLNDLLLWLDAYIVLILHLINHVEGKRLIKFLFDSIIA
jgi:hypothetical protein